MQDEQQYIPAGELCAYYDVELTFISSLEEYGLIEINQVAEKKLIPLDKLQELEKFIHLHYDLDINIEGIDAIQHLLQRVKSMQAEVDALRNKLKMYEM
ncbi:MAG TPA: chaperone modulator CbpM [Puia sp.]|nr:chaperone modulator CbpM [Puia sp.]